MIAGELDPFSSLWDEILALCALDLCAFLNMEFKYILGVLVLVYILTCFLNDSGIMTDFVKFLWRLLWAKSVI